MIGSVLDPREGGDEESKLHHFVNRKTPFCKVLRKEPLEIQEPLKSLDLTPPPTSQSDPRPESPDLCSGTCGLPR